MPAETYRFEEFELDAARYELRRDGAPVRVEPRVFDVLLYLVARRERVVAKHELLDSVWGSRFVSEAALTTALRAARAAVGDSGGEQRLIRTAHGRGYQFVGEVRVPDGGAEPATPAASVGAEHQSIRCCRAGDGTRIAYAAIGDGAPLVKAANWMSHLDLEWSTPVWSHWIKGLARNRTLIRYDERGCGLSDWEVPDFSLEAWVRDLETTPAASSASPCSACPRAEPWPSPTPRGTPSGSAASCWPAPTRAAAACGRPTRSNAPRPPSTWTWLVWGGPVRTRAS